MDILRAEVKAMLEGNVPPNITEPIIKTQSSKLVVDGYWGEKTTTALQKYFHTPADGKISKPSMVIKVIQGRVGSKQDGYLGPDTIRKMQKHFGTPIDGVISKPSLMVKEMQRQLNEGRF